MKRDQYDVSVPNDLKDLPKYMSTCGCHDCTHDYVAPVMLRKVAKTMPKRA